LTSREQASKKKWRDRIVAEYEFPSECLYSREDEWIRIEDDRVFIGVTDYAQQQLGDVVFLELPGPGDELQQGEPFGVIESVKAVSDLYAPFSGQIIEKNETLEERPELVNESCYEGGWLLSVATTDDTEYEHLMNARDYRKYVAERD
jgi:glycine cleavage system H protein